MVDFDAQAGRPAADASDVSDENKQSDADDVTDALDGLASLVSDLDGLGEPLTKVADLAVLAIPGAAGAGVTIIAAVETLPSVQTWAATSESVDRIDELQYRICEEGPCLTAMATGRTVVSGSLGSDARWPRFGGRVARMNIHSALSLPLTARGRVLGAVNVYAGERDAFGEHAVRLAEQFARPAAVTVHNVQLLQQVHDRAGQLQSALTSRAVIDQAIGIVRSRSGGTEREAFDRLRGLSQGDNVKLSVVAQRLVDDAVRRAHARTSSTADQ